MRVRPCIDIHNGKVKQIVGGTLHAVSGNSSEEREVLPEQNGRQDLPERQEGIHAGSAAEENFVSVHDAAYYAAIYREKNLPGGHIILLNSKAAEPEMYEADRELALAALREWPGGMQIGGGITPENAAEFLDAGASHVIVTSYVFRNGELDRGRLARMEQAAGRDHLVLDLSCRRWSGGRGSGDRNPLQSREPRNGGERPLQLQGMRSADQGVESGNVYRVVTDRWQKWTDFEVNGETLDLLSSHCDEFLIHAADVEGKQRGVETGLVRIMGQWLAKHPFPVTYAGGVHSFSDIDLLRDVSDGRLDFTIGSALDLFGGSLGLDEVAAYAGKGKPREQQGAIWSI